MPSAIVDRVSERIATPSPELSHKLEGAAPFPELSQQLEKDLVQVFKLLADETRLKILMGLLREGEMHVSAMCDMLNQSQPAVSHHLALLRQAGIVEPRRDGKHNYYSVCQNRFHLLMGELFSTVSNPQRDEFRFKSFVVTKDENVVVRSPTRSNPSERRVSSREIQKCDPITLERFNGLVDYLERGTAFVTLTSTDGERLIGEYPASEFAKLGIHERRRFICQTVVVNGQVEVRFQAIPDLEVTRDEEVAIDREINELISGGELDGDY